ncbi:MAG: hypothetical protein JWM87_3911, partial [Candidatus Eremiobacteraeota bacterium]|nr:hypothetical protein [Candidatus Eremiobacteraeota bacterium]
MRATVRRAGVAMVALSFALCSLPAPAEIEPLGEGDPAKALAMLQLGCGAQASQAERASLAQRTSLAAHASASADGAAGAQASATIVVRPGGAVVAQASGAPEASASSSPAPSPGASTSPSPTPSPFVGSPSAPNGPQILIPRAASP